MARARRSSGFPARPRRVYEWSGIARTKVNDLSGNQSQGAVTIGLAALQPSTIVRIRGSYAVHMDPGAIADGHIVGLGIAIVSTDAFTAGSASMPSPLDDPGYPFIWHRLFNLQTSTATESDNSIVANMAGEIDSKAMRKIKVGEVIGFIWDGLVLAGAPTSDGVASIRILSLR